jgi:hypothetical protein
MDFILRLLGGVIALLGDTSLLLQAVCQPVFAQKFSKSTPKVPLFVSPDRRNLSKPV